MTGLGKWSWCGDAQLEVSRSGKPLTRTPGTEAERLAKADPSGSTAGVIGIKTDNAIRK
ncbi:MAG: hypothetical protein IPM25_04820 [Chloracidobacterium sp.]|nr:hypothetical protein [Chloracidobacterium sp.]